MTGQVQGQEMKEKQRAEGEDCGRMAVSSTRVSQKLMPCTFYVMLFTSWTYENFTELYYNIAGRHTYFQPTVHLC
jgi:hypothetical protein